MVNFVFFGSFDPINNNYMTIFQYLIDKYNPYKLFIIPVNNEKSIIAPIESRIDMIKLSLNTLSNNYKYKILIWEPRKIITTNRGKQMICDNIQSRYKDTLKVIIGSDSLQHSIWNKFPYNIIVLPRMNYDYNETNSDNITLDLDYQDREIISSKTIRDYLDDNEELLANLYHPTIIKYIRDYNLYSDKSNFSDLKTIIPVEYKTLDMDLIILIGSPGSGKTTIGKMLADRKRYKFISTGDLWRQCESQQGKDNELGKQYDYIAGIRSINRALFKERLEKFIMNQLINIFNEHINRSDNMNYGIVIDGFKENDFTHFQMNIGKINKVYELLVDTEIAKDRMINRQNNRSDDDVENIEKRLKIYHNFYGKNVHRELEQLGIQLIQIITNNLSYEQVISSFII